MHGWRRAYTDACSPSSHAWRANSRSKLEEQTRARGQAMHGWRRAHTDACALSSHAWLKMRAVRPCMAGGGLIRGGQPVPASLVSSLFWPQATPWWLPLPLPFCQSWTALPPRCLAPGHCPLAEPWLWPSSQRVQGVSHVILAQRRLIHEGSCGAPVRKSPEEVLLPLALLKTFAWMTPGGWTSLDKLDEFDE
jgi:hypothetical protein